MTEAEALEQHERAQSASPQEALALLQPVADFFLETEGPLSPDLANVLLDLADAQSALCLYAEASQSAARAVAILDEIAPLLDPETRAALVPRALTVYGVSLCDLGDYTASDTILTRAVEQAEQPYLVNALNALGVLCKYSRQFDRAESAYRRALALVIDAEDDETIATLHHNLGGLEFSRGNFAAGEPLARKACELRRKLHGPDDLRTLADEVALGGILDGLGRHAESIRIYRRALEIYERHLGPAHFEVAATLHNLGHALDASGSAGEARSCLERALEIKRGLFGREDHPEVALTRARLDRLA